MIYLEGRSNSVGSNKNTREMQMIELSEKYQ